MISPYLCSSLGSRRSRLTRKGGKEAMCDYSLHNIKQRNATEGEPLQVYKFPSGSLGLASPGDLRPVSLPEIAKRGLWKAIAALFSRAPTVCAVCIPPGARLILRDIPLTLQAKLGVKGEEAEVTFFQANLASTNYRDSIRADRGKEMTLQGLPVGLVVDVLSLTGDKVGLPDVKSVTTSL